jgi:catechol 2,3-dioxygenase-like lactoylglutathione lyase family enzyme
MLTHVSIGVKDIARSKRFYDEALRPPGYRCVRAATSAEG